MFMWWGQWQGGKICPGFSYRCESNKKESSKIFSFRRIVLKIENYNYFHSTGVHKEGALSISHFKSFPF